MRWLQGMLSTQPEWFNQTAPIEQIITYADQAGYDAADPINEHLPDLSYLKSNFLKRSGFIAQGLLLTSLDKLFVGTLDSLAQNGSMNLPPKLGISLHGDFK